MALDGTHSPVNSARGYPRPAEQIRDQRPRRRSSTMSAPAGAGAGGAGGGWWTGLGGGDGQVVLNDAQPIAGAAHHAVAPPTYDEASQLPPHPSMVLRTPSQELAGVTGFSREIVRRALDDAGGDPNIAVSNLLFNVLDTTEAPIVSFARQESLELSEFAGISRDLARQHLDAFDGDLERAKRALLTEMFGVSEASLLSGSSYEGDAAGGGGGGGGSARGGGATGDSEGRARQALLENRTEFECVVCYGDIEPGAGCQLRGCGHMCCKACLRRHIDAKSASGESLVACVAPDCTIAISQREVRALVGTEAFAKLDRRALEQAAACDPSLHLCPTPDCTYITMWCGVGDGQPKVDCPICSKQYCLVCVSTPYHDGKTCAERKAEVDVLAGVGGGAGAAPGDADEEATRQYLEASNIRICNRCSVPLIKESGCNKMKCRCGYRFCYLCGAENAQCDCTPSAHGFWDNETDRGDFSRLRDSVAPP